LIHLTRRHLLASTPLAGAAILAACTSTTNPVAVTSTVAQDADLIAGGLASAIATLQATPGVLTTAQQATLTQLQGYLATIKADAATIAAATATPATSVVSEIVQLVQTIAPIALSFVPGGGAIVAIVNAALSLAPQLLTDIGVTGATATSGAPPVYSVASARQILRSATAK
jgi:hypothetical protein